MNTFSGILLLFWAIAMPASLGQAPPPNQPATPSEALLARHYQEGEKLAYRMKATNENWKYEIEAVGTVKKNSAGSFFEEYSWTHLVSDGKPVGLRPETDSFRQIVSLSPEIPPAVPNLSQADLRLVGPITDWLTFYADLWLANKLNKLNREGDHFYFKRGTPNSWADGNYVVLGEDSIDFDFSLAQVNPSEKFAVLIARHMVPEKPEIRIPAEWMRAPVADTPNNWVEVEKLQNGKYLAEIGKETFEVEMKISLVNGRIVSAKLNNPVDSRRRECLDAALTNCGEATPHHILRHVEVQLAN